MAIIIIIIIIINEEIIVAFSPKTTRTRYKVKKEQNREKRRV